MKTNKKITALFLIAGLLAALAACGRASAYGIYNNDGHWYTADADFYFGDAQKLIGDTLEAVYTQENAEKFYAMTQTDSKYARAYSMFLYHDGGEDILGLALNTQNVYAEKEIGDITSFTYALYDPDLREVGQAVFDWELKQPEEKLFEVTARVTVNGKTVVFSDADDAFPVQIGATDISGAWTGSESKAAMQIDQPEAFAKNGGKTPVTAAQIQAKADEWKAAGEIPVGKDTYTYSNLFYGDGSIYCFVSYRAEDPAAEPVEAVAIHSGNTTWYDYEEHTAAHTEMYVLCDHDLNVIGQMTYTTGDIEEAQGLELLLKDESVFLDLFSPAAEQ